jgi:hypothetical protein
MSSLLSTGGNNCTPVGCAIDAFPVPAETTEFTVDVAALLEASDPDIPRLFGPLIGPAVIPKVA